VKIAVNPVEHLIVGFHLFECLVSNLALEPVHSLHLVGSGGLHGFDSTNPRAHLLPCLIRLTDECAAQKVCNLDCGESPSCFDAGIDSGMDFLHVWV
jgi:hypothetical protein